MVTNPSTEEKKKLVIDNIRIKFRYTIGQYCAALFNGDWYRARVLETEENRVHVQYIDW